MKHQESNEMYLETILVLLNRADNVKSIDIAQEMNYSKPSVSIKIKQLKNDGLININEKGYITLTKKGLEIADNIYNKHQTLTKLLVKAGVSIELAEQDACKIEHHISQSTYLALKRLLKKI